MDITLLSSIDSAARAAGGARLAEESPAAALLSHELLDGDRVLRRLYRNGSLKERAETGLKHGCLSCAVRFDIVPAVERLIAVGAEDAVVVLPPGVALRMASEALRSAFGAAAHLVRAIVAIDPAAVEEAIWESSTLAELGVTCSPDDMRTPGEFLLGEIGWADTALAVSGLSSVLAAGGRRVSERARGLELLGELAPHLALALAGERLPPAHFDVSEALARSRPGEVRVPAAALPGRFATAHHRLSRPLHPARLEAALPQLAAGSHWLRGRLWVASALDCRIVVSGVGPRVSLESAGPWPSGPLLPGSSRRGTELAATSDVEDAAEGDFRDLLEECQLTPSEAARWGVPELYDHRTMDKGRNER